MKIKICQFTIAHLLEDERIYHKECKSLLREYDVTLVSTSDFSGMREGINVVGLGKPEGFINRLKRVFTILPVLKRQNCAVYHFHDPELIVTGYLLKKFYGKKVVYDVHEHYTNKMKSKHFGSLNFMKGLIIGIWRRIEIWMANQLDLIVTADTITAKQFRADKTISIGNFPTLEFVQDSVPKNVVAEEDFRVVYLGTIHEQRGLRKCVEAIEKVKYPGIKLHIIGSCRFPELTELFESSPRVVFHGRIPWEVLNKELAKCHVGLILLQPVSAFTYIPGENIVKLFEYAGMGIPYLMSDFKLLHMFTEEFGGGLTVDPTDTDAIARKIEFLYENPDVYRRLSEEGIRFVQQQFNWDMQEQKLLTAYRGILNEKQNINLK